MNNSQFGVQNPFNPINPYSPVNSGYNASAFIQNGSPAIAPVYTPNFASPIANTPIPYSAGVGAGAGSGAGALNYGAGALGSGIGGLVQAGIGLYGLSQMGDRPQYGFNDVYNNSIALAQQKANEGLSASEYRNAQQQMNTQQRTTQQAILNASGGNLSQALAGISNAQNLTENSKLAGISSQVQRANRAEFLNVANQQQSKKDMYDNDKIGLYDKTKQAYGQAISSGLQNLMGATNYASLFI